MNTRALVRGISGKSLLAFVGMVLLLGVVAGEAAGATVSGQVTKANVLGVPNLFVVATTPAPNFTFLAQAQTDANGNYAISLPNMPGGTNFLVFVDLTGTRLVSDLKDTIEKTLTFQGVDITGVNFKLVDGVKLSGTVTNTIPDPDSPASGVIVFALHLDSDPALNFKFLGQVTTGANGTYGLLVPPNETAELAVDNGKFPGTVVDPAFLDVDVVTTDREPFNFSLIPGVTVQGHVTDGVNPISNALVEAFFVDPDPSVPWKWLGDDTTGFDGFYSVTVALKWEQIRLRVTAAGFVERRVDVVLDTNPKTVDIALSNSVQISGKVTDASTGLGVPNVPVEADFGTQVLDVGSTGDGVTSPLGSYTLDVPPNQGLVTIHVDATKINYLQPGDGELLVGTADFTGIDFALTPSVDITGTVTNAQTTNPIGGAGVTVFQGSITLAFALTDDKGFYTLKVAVNQGVVDIHVDAGTSFQTADKLVTVAGSPITQDFALKPAVQAEKVTITRADWASNLLTVFATDSLQPNATLKVTVVKNGTTVVNNATMTFSTKRKQYEFRLRIKADLNGGKVTVTSNSGVSAGPATIPLSAPCVSGTLCL